MTSKREKLVVVGNGMAGVACVEQVLHHAPKFDITILPDYGVIGPVDCTTEVPLGSACQVGPSNDNPL